MTKDELSENAKTIGKKGDTTKSSANSPGQIRPSAAPGLRPPAPRPSFAGPMPIATNIKNIPAMTPLKESVVLKTGESKDE